MDDVKSGFSYIMGDDERQNEDRNERATRAVFFSLIPLVEPGKLYTIRLIKEIETGLSDMEQFNVGRTEDVMKIKIELGAVYVEPPSAEALAEIEYTKRPETNWEILKETWSFFAGLINRRKENWK